MTLFITENPREAITEHQLTHVCPTSTGGVFDYIDICIQHHPSAIKLPLSKTLAKGITFSGNVLLHLSGYGYQKRGAPLWLLHKLKAERANIKTLGVFFHELYAFGPPWKSSFWLSPIQRHIARQLAELSDYWITNREGSSQWLRQFAGNVPNAALPIFSTVGEAPTYLPIRLRTVVIFGLPSVRENTYRMVGDKLFDWAHRQGLEIHDIGSPIVDESILVALKKNNVKLHGRLEASEVSRIFSNASFGILSYSVEYIAKSTIFAAFCAHGVCPILISDSYADTDGLVAEEHYLAGIPDMLMDHERVGQSAWEWYQNHRMQDHVEMLTKLMNKECGI